MDDDIQDYIPAPVPILEEAWDFDEPEEPLGYEGAYMGEIDDDYEQD